MQSPATHCGRRTYSWSIRITKWRLTGRYKGRVLAVSGLVKDIGNDITNTPYVILGENVDNPIGTQALFQLSERGSVAGLSKGQRVTVLCRGGGR